MLKFILLLLLILATQFGWRFTKEYTFKLSPQEKALSARLKDEVSFLVNNVGVRNLETRRVRHTLRPRERQTNTERETHTERETKVHRETHTETCKIEKHTH